MITNTIPILHRKLAAAIAATPHLQEGKLAKLDASGNIALATSADDYIGVICSPDSHATALAGNVTEADIVLRPFGGFVELQLSDTAAVTPGTKLTIDTTNACLKVAGDSDTVVALAVDAATATTPGQLVRAVLL